MSEKESLGERVFGDYPCFSVDDVERLQELEEKEAMGGR